VEQDARTVIIHTGGQPMEIQKSDGIVVVHKKSGVEVIPFKHERA
jgi:hypothetical protein